MIILNSPHMTTELNIWAPRYSSAYTETGEKVALLAKYKVDKATPVFRVRFTKAKHLDGQRFAIRKDTAQSYPLDSNGTIACYAVPMSAFHDWATQTEVNNLANMPV
jgi:hypothetical protein